jgi:hypothetical protein
MGTTVLESGVPARAGLHVYAHCLRGAPGGVALLAINTSRSEAQSLDLPLAAEGYALTAQQLDDTQIQLNGGVLRLQANDELPDLQGRHIVAGPVALAPASITFLAFADARNASCQNEGLTGTKP